MNHDPEIQPAGRIRDRPPAYLAWEMTTWVAGVFSALVGLAMIVGHFNAKSDDPLNSPRLKQSKEELRLRPADEQFKQRIRELDLRLRSRYFSHLSRMGSGVHLLLGGVGLFVLASTRRARFRKRPPMPRPKEDLAEETARHTGIERWSVAGSGTAVGTFLFVISLTWSTALPKRAADLDKLLGTASSTALASDAASLEEMRQNWPRFRGLDGSGVSAFTNLPARWDPATSEGIAWKTAVPAAGFNSPIVWGDRIFLSGGNASLREVFCLDAKTGQIVWRQPVTVAGGVAPAYEIPESTGYAAETMATDGRRVYVVFANGDVAAFTLEGGAAWSRNLGPVKNPYGHATSLATWRDRLIVQFDQDEKEDGRSKLYALEGRTGRTVWQRPRNVGASWATPIVIEAAGKSQVITLSVPWVIAYAATDGAELWRVDCLNGEVTPSPIFAGRLLFVVSPSEKLLAIRPDGRGDVTKSHVVWTTEDNVPDVTSPVSNGDLVFTLTTSGVLTCFDARDGRKLWEHDYEMECHTSPSLAGDRLLLFGQKGSGVVVAAAREFKEMFRTEMGDAFHASPAFAGDRMFLRGVTNVWCVGAGEVREKVAKQQ